MTGFQLKESFKYFHSKFLFIILMGILLFPTPALSAGLNQVKAAFLFNFFHYVNWSESAFAATQSSVNICVIADDEFTELLQLTIKDESIHNQPISVQSATTQTPPTNCHILFVSHTKTKKIPTYVNTLINTLIVSDIENSVNQGSMIELRTIENKVKLFINLTLTKQFGLSINSRLLSLATVIENE